MGYAAHEFAGFGLPLPRRVSLTEEGLDILQLAWSGEPFSYEGKRYTYRDVRVTPDPVQDGGPPLWIAATSEAGALRAARFDTNLLPQGPKSTVLEPWKQALADDGRDPGDKRVGIIRGVYVTDGRDPADDPTWEAIAAAERYRRECVHRHHQGQCRPQVRLLPNAAARTGPRQPDPLNPLVWTAGDADHCVADLTTMMRDHDVTDLVSWGGPPGLPPSVMNASLERFANDVVPRIRSQTRGLASWRSDQSGSPGSAAFEWHRVAAMDIADRLDLHELPGRYGDIIDDRDWDRLGTIFTDDAVFDLTDLGAPRLAGLTAIRDFMADEAEHPRTHTMTNIYVNETADAVELKFRILALIGGGKVGTASYHYLVVKTPDGWRVKDRMLKRRRTQVYPD